MHHSIALQSVLVTIMVHLPVKCIGIYAKVAYDHRFKKQTEGVQISDQIFGTKAKSSSRNGGVYKITGVRSTYRSLGSEVRTPRRHVFNNENFFKGYDI